MIAGFTIMLDRPFRVGDRIQLASGEKGDVVEIGLRSTKILTFENTLLIIPNESIVKEMVWNLSYPNPIIRVKVDVGVAYGTDPERVKQIMVDVAKQHPEVLDDPEPKAYLINFGDSSLDFTLVGRVANYGDQWRVQEELRIAIYKAFEKEGIEIPFPQRVVHMVQPKQ
jgi:small-conductance mechanosensitive channel